ncbi:MAG: hypothetical protein AAF292_09600 [Pseudomonadota bacterium]
MTTELILQPEKVNRRREPQLQNWWAALCISGGVYLFISWAILQRYPEAKPRFRINLDPLIEAPVALQVHVAAAISTFFIGLILLNSPKGKSLHKILGWTWVATMAMTAGSSFLLSGISGDRLSFIHGLSAWTLISLPMAVAAIRQRKVQSHAKNMTSLFLGGMAIAGIFTFLPGRLMWDVFVAM